MTHDIVEHSKLFIALQEETDAMQENKNSNSDKAKVDPHILRIALFGESGAGKTTLLGSFYGRQQSDSFSTTQGYRLSTPSTKHSGELLEIYHNLQYAHAFPMGTTDSHMYIFEFNINNIKNPAFTIELIDYPGGWWRNNLDSQEEEMRTSCLKKLVESHVGFLLLDGQRFRDEHLPYLRLTLDVFKNEIMQLTTRQEVGAKPLITNWVIALNKAGSMPHDYSAESFRHDIVDGAKNELEGLAKAINPTNDSVKISFHFMLLSSVGVCPDGTLNVNQTLGLDLIAPVATKAILDCARERQEKEKTETPWWQWINRLRIGIHALSRYLPKKYKAAAALIEVFNSIASEPFNKAEEDWQKRRDKAAAKGAALEAAMYIMSNTLNSPVGRRAYCPGSETE